MEMKMINIKTRHIMGNKIKGGGESKVTQLCTPEKMR